MTRAEARTAIQSAYETVGGAPTSTELNTWIDLEHKLFRRQLAKSVPQIYTATDTQQVLAAGSDSLTLPSDYERLVRLEKLSGSDWYPVDISDELSPHLGCLTVREEGTALKVDPVLDAPGTYRIVYVQKPVTLSADSGTGGVLLVPDGCEDIIVERCAARARVKQEEDPGPHLARANDVWTEQKRALRKRYGRSPKPGLRMVRNW